MDFDLREYVSLLLEQAKQNLKQDGYLVPVAFIVTAEQILLVPVAFEGPEEKTQAYGKVVEVAREHNALAIVTLNDARYSTDTSQESVEAYYPGKLAAERAPECISITVSGPAITTWALTVPYERTQEGIVFGQAKESSGGKLHLLPGWASDSATQS